MRLLYLTINKLTLLLSLNLIQSSTIFKRKKMKRFILFAGLLALLFGAACTQHKNHIEKEIVFDEGMTPEQS